MALLALRMMNGTSASASFGCFFKNADSWEPLQESMNHRFGEGPEFYFKPLPLVILSSLKSREPWLKVL